MFANYEHDVVGYDVDEAILDTLRDGDIHIEEPGLRAFVNEAISSGYLTVDSEVPAADVHIVCVPTPFDEADKSPKLDYVESAGTAVSEVLREGDTVILESTVPPGTTENVLSPKLEESGLEAGVDFSLAHCPETVLPGNVITELRQNNRIVGGVDPESTEIAVELYSSFVESDIHTTDDATTAEFVKLIQNTFRDTNIALANEIAKVAHDYEIDSREAIRLANMHPRVNIHHPGPGVGGHCLPIDPWFLGHGSDSLEMIELARDINDGMSEYISDILSSSLDGLGGTKIAILGIAYKGNVGDTRKSPGLKLARELQQKPAEMSAVADGGEVSEVDVSIHDSYVTDQTIALQSFEEALSDADAVVISTDHTEYESIDPHRVQELMRGTLVIDTKAILPVDEWMEIGFDVSTI